MMIIGCIDWVVYNFVTGGFTLSPLLAVLIFSVSLTTARLAELTGLTPKGIEWQIAQLKKNGLLERIGPDRGGHWKVKEN